MTLLLPSVHPHASEPLITESGFSIELWTDWLVPGNAVDRYRNAAAGIPTDDRTVGRATTRGRVTVERSVLWVSVIASGPGPADDGAWSLADDHFRRLWSEVHERAHAAR